jgi:uncharacterized protein YigE (DUF2233 family)
MQAKSLTAVLIIFLTSFQPTHKSEDNYTSFITTADKIKMYWKKDGRVINNFIELKKIEPNLVFAMNGGMFDPGYAPVGLFVENGKEINKIKKVNNPNVNFGLQPQGIFLTRNKKAEVIAIDDYKPDHVSYATQSAPMLVIDSKMNPQLPIGKNYIRNGVGILPDGKILMAVSKTRVTFHQFAQFFIDNKCTGALYLDGAISEAYTGKAETYGSFGVMIGVIK